jgi:uncharacterized protein (TIGR02145 family)
LDTYGFSALPGGGRSSYFSNAGHRGNWWSASEYTAGTAYYQVARYLNEYAPSFGADPKYWGYSVRCLQD